MAETRRDEPDGAGRSRAAEAVTSGPAADRRPSRSFARDACGATALEYALIAGLIFAVVAGGIRAYGARTATVYGRIGDAMAQVE